MFLFGCPAQGSVWVEGSDDDGIQTRAGGPFDLARRRKTNPVLCILYTVVVHRNILSLLAQSATLRFESMP